MKEAGEYSMLDQCIQKPRWERAWLIVELGDRLEGTDEGVWSLP